MFVPRLARWATASTWSLKAPMDAGLRSNAMATDIMAQSNGGKTCVVRGFWKGSVGVFGVVSPPATIETRMPPSTTLSQC